MKLKQSKDEMLEQASQTRAQLKGLDNLKLQKINNDQDYIKALIGGIESRIAEEVERRMKNEFEGKNFVESKLQSFKEEMVGGGY